MTIIDRYVLRHFARSFAIFFITVMGLYIVFDLFTNMENFLDAGAKQGGFFQFATVYYSFRAVLLFDRLSILLALISATFTITWLQRHNEMTALLAAGISQTRIVLPVLVVAAILIFLQCGVRETLIPRFRDQLARDPSDLLGEEQRPVQPCYDHETDVRFDGQYAIRKDKSILRPSIYLPRQHADFGRTIQGTIAYGHAASEGRPPGFLIENVSDPSDIDATPSLYDEERPVVLTPHDTPWLSSGQCFVVSQVSFDQLVGGQVWRQYSSTIELIAGLRNPSLDFGTDVKTIVHTRILQPLGDITLLLLGLPLILSRSQRNVFVAMGQASLLVFAFITTQYACQALGTYYAMPAFAAWLPLLIFVPIAAMMSDVWRQ